MVQSRPLDPRQSFSAPYTCPPSEAAARHPSLQQDRYHHDAAHRHDTMHYARYDEEVVQSYDMSRRGHMRQVNDILRTRCGIEAKHYFVISVTEEGDINFHFSPGKQLPESIIRKFFNFETFLGFVKMHANGELKVDEEPDNRQRGLDRRQSSTFDEASAPGRQARKRPRARQNEDNVMTSVVRRPLVIGESETVWEFYQEQFRNCQQTACKLIAKAWVKVVEPKKQSAHPYTGKEVPDWWPKPWGPSKEDAVRHKEPDHLYKRERVHLLAHILRMVVKPRDKQHPDIQKLDLSVQKLKDATFEALSSFLTETEANGKKRTFLNELFRAAIQEQRYKNGEIDGATQVMVLDDKKTESCMSDNEDQSFIKEEDDYDTPMMRSTTTHGLIQAPGEDPTATNMRAGSFMSDLPMRESHFSPTLMTDVAAQSHSFESGGMVGHTQSVVNSATASIGLDMVTSPHDTSRRPSVFSDYASTSSNNLYSPQWQPNSAGPNASSIYPYTTTQPTQVSSAFSGQNVQMGQTQSFLASSFEGSPRQEYEQGSNSMFVGGTLPQPPVHQPHGYDYMTTDGRDMRAIPRGVDGMPRNQMH